MAKWIDFSQADRNWEFLPHFIVRTTGFPFELVEKLRMKRSTDAVTKIFEAESTRNKLRQELNSGLFVEVIDAANHKGCTKQEIKLIYTVMRAAARMRRANSDNLLKEVLVELKRGQELKLWIERWNESLTNIERLRQLAKEIFTKELVESRKALKEIAESHRFQEALFISNPEGFSIGFRYFLKHWQTDKRPPKFKAKERMIWKYLQRFCTKNETVSFIGPANFGKVNRRLPGTLSPVNAKLGNNLKWHAFLTYWTTSKLAELISQDSGIRPYLKPRLSSICELLPDNRLRMHGMGRTVTLPNIQAKLLAAANGKRTLQELEKLSELGHQEFDKALQVVSKPGVLLCEIAIPASVADALEYLISKVNDLPNELKRKEYWLGILKRFSDYCATFEGAGIQQRVESLAGAEQLFYELTGQHPRRGQGQTYADRMLMYEESAGNLDCLELRRDLNTDLIRHMTPVLNFLAGAACAVQQRRRQAASQAFIARFGKEGKASYLETIKHFAATIGKGALFETKDLPELQALQSKIVKHSKEPAVHLNSHDLPQFDGFADKTLITSPDLMISAESIDAIKRGQYKLVFGEVHSGILVWGQLTFFHPQRDQLANDLRSCIDRASTGDELVNVAVTRKHKNPPFEYPGRTIDLSACSAKQDEKRIPAAKVSVYLKDGSLCLCDQVSGKDIQLYLGDQWCLFSPPDVKQIPLRTGKHTPRIEIDDAVYQRERWQIEPGDEDLPKMGCEDFEIFYRMLIFRVKNKLPLEVFARSLDERKPVYVNFENFFALELLVELFGKDKQVELTEMLPGSQDLWLEGVEGRHTSEFRTTIFGIPDCNEPNTAD